VNNDELVERFRFHDLSEDQKERIKELRNKFEEFVREIEKQIPCCRESVLVFTRLEEASFWANKAVSLWVRADSRQGAVP
jgi:SMC interacting uncharacterized protein involved in chromosome segregation